MLLDAVAEFAAYYSDKQELRAEAADSNFFASSENMRVTPQYA
jgi:hypothetical protein